LHTLIGAVLQLLVSVSVAVAIVDVVVAAAAAAAALLLLLLLKLLPWLFNMQLLSFWVPETGVCPL